MTGIYALYLVLKVQKIVTNHSFKTRPLNFHNICNELLHRVMGNILIEIDYYKALLSYKLGYLNWCHNH